MKSNLTISKCSTGLSKDQLQLLCGLFEDSLRIVVKIVFRMCGLAYPRLWEVGLRSMPTSITLGVAGGHSHIVRNAEDGKATSFSIGIR